MTDITTSITICLKHSRQLSEQEFRTISGNILEHVQHEHRAGIDGFADSNAIGVLATHEVNGAAVYAAENQELEWVDAPAA